MWKNVSSSKTTSGLIDTESSSTGCGGVSNVYDMSVGWIMINELFTSSSLRMCLVASARQRPRAHTAADAPRTCKTPSRPGCC
jgi:hypothetical protein